MGERFFTRAAAPEAGVAEGVCGAREVEGGRKR